jgi:transducin (beta)-like 1
MDADEVRLQHADGNAYPSPEQVPSPVAATLGPEQGTQLDKVSELATETSFLDLTDDVAGAGVGAGAAAATAKRNPILLQCEWNPRDPTILAAAGSDALARMWTVSSADSSTADATADSTDPNVQSQGQPRASVYYNLLDESAPQGTTVTGLTWSLDGRHIAIASEILDEGTAKIEVWNTDGMSLASYMAFESPIVCLRWNPPGVLLLALSPDVDGCLVTIMCPSKQTSIQIALPNHSLAEQSLDAAWTAHDEFVICGGDLLQAFHGTSTGISFVRKYETREGHALSKAAFDWPSRLLATASDTGMIDVSFFYSSLFTSTDISTDLGPEWPMQLLQCTSRPHHLAGMAAYAESPSVSR